MMIGIPWVPEADDHHHQQRITWGEANERKKRKMHHFYDNQLTQTFLWWLQRKRRQAKLTSEERIEWRVAIYFRTDISKSSGVASRIRITECCKENSEKSNHEMCCKRGFTIKNKRSRENQRWCFREESSHQLISFSTGHKSTTYADGHKRHKNQLREGKTGRKEIKIGWDRRTPTKSNE